MNYVAGQNCLCAVYHKKWCESCSAVWRGPQPPEYGVELLYPVHVRFLEGPHLSGFDAAHDNTICMFDLAVSLWVIDGSIIELDAHIFAPEFNLVGREICAVVSDDAVGDAKTVYYPGCEVYHRSEFCRFNRLGFNPFGEFVHHDQ